jgi:hypothetical protein
MEREAHRRASGLTTDDDRDSGHRGGHDYKASTHDSPEYIRGEL